MSAALNRCESHGSSVGRAVPDEDWSGYADAAGAARPTIPRHPQGYLAGGIAASRLQRENSPTMDSAAAYETHADAFLRARDNSPVGSRVVARWSALLPVRARVLELACGGGFPVTRVLAAAGLRLWAIDSSPTLVAAFRARFPEIPVQCARVQDSDFFGRDYQAAIAIGLLFLLPEPEQVQLISRVADRLAPGGRFLFSAPVETGTWRDLNTGHTCQSLGQHRYEALLQEAGFSVLASQVDGGANHYYDVRKRGANDFATT